jgi:peptidoglycan/LPS O-acetylase OafA/YrhL
MNNPDYRPDIDGLRAFAVILVILFHLDVSLFSGGFVGVDVFFVISGFLITRIITNEILETKRFSFSNFYLRRARRILPALFFTLILSFGLGYLLFAPQHFERLGGALVHAVLSVSNFYFWGESDYFNTASEFKPLLHTWYLGIEEQFYIFWPLFLLLIVTKMPKSMTSFVIVMVGLFSLGLNAVFAAGPDSSWLKPFPAISGLLQEGSSNIFFLTPFRVFEFAIGACLVRLVNVQPGNKILLEPLVVIGLFMIIYPAMTYTEDIVFPSFNALLPCLGTGLLIYSGTAAYSGRLLDNKLAVGIGLISYSLYLIHWPLIVFYKYWKLGEFNTVDKAGIATVATVCAAMMYRMVEQPFRRGATAAKKSNRVFAAACAMVAAMLVYPAVKVWRGDGWLWRFDAKLADQINFDAHHYDDYVWARHIRLRTDFADNGKPKVVVIGDSMAADFVNVLGESNQFENLDVVTLPIGHRCKSVFPLSPDTYRKYLPGSVEKCRQQHEKVMNSPLLDHADTVVLASLWDGWEIELIDSTVQFLKSKGVPQVAVVGRKDQSVNGVKFNAQFAFRRSAHRLRTLVGKAAERKNAKIAGLESDFIFINLLEHFCDDTGCQRVTDEGYLIIYDKTHLSPMGARMIGLRATESAWMKALLRNKADVETCASTLLKSAKAEL